MMFWATSSVAERCHAHAFWWARSSVVERCPDKTEDEGSIPSAPTKRHGSDIKSFLRQTCLPAGRGSWFDPMRPHQYGVDF